jgi:hypothetical protein
LIVTAVNRTDSTTVELILNRPHSLETETYIGIREIFNLIGFYKIINVTNRTISIEVSEEIEDPVIDESTTVNLQLLTEARFKNTIIRIDNEDQLIIGYQNVDQGVAALYKNGSKIFVDDNGSGLWEVVEKNKQYSSRAPNDYGISVPAFAGSKVVYDNNNKHIISSIPDSGIVTVHVESRTGLILKQIISPPVGFFNTVLGSFGNSMSISLDGKYLIVGAPEASGVTSNYRGEWGPDVFYGQDDIVLYKSRLWKAKNANTVRGDGSTTAAVNTDDWEVTLIIPALVTSRDAGKFQQGIVAVYEYINGRYVNTAAILSPRPADNEKFGFDVSIGKNGTNYSMAVSAVGSYNDTGRVYIFNYDGTAWSHSENPSYRGEYDQSETYYAGDIVWQAAQDPLTDGVKGNLWQAQENQPGDGSTITLESSTWVKVSEISTNSSLPTNVSIEDDGSTLEFAYTGLLSTNQLAELVKPGDQFGFSITMSSDANILVVGAPYADGQFFANYRGVWRSDVEYVEGEVVKHKNPIDVNYQYYKLGDAYLGADSTYRSYNEDPSDSENWQVVGDSTTTASGKMFVYKRNTYGS